MSRVVKHHRIPKAILKIQAVLYFFAFAELQWKTMSNKINALHIPTLGGAMRKFPKPHVDLSIRTTMIFL